MHCKMRHPGRGVTGTCGVIQGGCCSKASKLLFTCFWKECIEMGDVVEILHFTFWRCFDKRRPCLAKPSWTLLEPCTTASLPLKH
jgi:hypothetical protein